MADTGSDKLVVRNIGLLISGDLAKPILDADTIVAEGGRIVAVGKAADVDCGGATVVVDAKGTTVTPGLIDSHVHPVFGDWTPRQSQLGWIDSCMNGGVTMMVSAGEVHLPGRPKDIVGLKALAITAQRAFSSFRPGGVKVLAGAPVVEHGMVEQDFKDLADAGVTLLGEIGLGGVKQGAEARQMVAWARKYGIGSTIHTGGPSIPGSGLIDRDVVMEADADVIGHINGGHTALPLDQIRDLCADTTRAIEIVHNGNEKAALHALHIAREIGQLDRVILGTDAPAGSGRPAARHPARHRTAGEPRRPQGRAGLLPRDRQHGQDPRPRGGPDRGRPARATWRSWTAPSTPRGAPSSRASRWATWRALAWSSSTARSAAAAAATRPPRRRCRWSRGSRGFKYSRPGRSLVHAVYAFRIALLSRESAVR